MNGPRRANRFGNAMNKGFTLPELLVVMSIIGTLSAAGVVSFSSARASARDAKRVSDMKQIQTALELYFENNNHYPGDARPGNEGKILGSEGAAMVLSDAGFGPVRKGTPYMILVPKNPLPGGGPYIYRALNRDGSNCDTAACDSYAILFSTERPIGNYKAGPHAMTPAGVAGAEGGYAGAGIVAAGGQIIGIEGAQARLAEIANSATSAVYAFALDKRVQTATEVAVAPTAAAVAVVNTALSVSSAVTYAFYFFTQPVLLLGRRKRKAWGTVYNPLSRLGEDLVIVRLRDARTGRIVKSTVTDTEGRYSFLAQSGRYRIEAAKNGFAFPSALTEGKREDGTYTDIYHGEVIEVAAEASVLTPNIPMDPVSRDEADEVVAKKYFFKKVRRAVAVASPVLGGLTLLVRPSAFVGLLFAFQTVSYMLFRRLAAPPEPNGWGIVYDQMTRRPVPNAVLRIFEAKYNKLLESQVADRRGRYHFRVGGNVYYLTVTKPGYLKTETEPVDLTGASEPTVIASDLPILAEPRPAPAAS